MTRNITIMGPPGSTLTGQKSWISGNVFNFVPDVVGTFWITSDSACRPLTVTLGQVGTSVSIAFAAEVIPQGRPGAAFTLSHDLVAGVQLSVTVQNGVVVKAWLVVDDAYNQQAEFASMDAGVVAAVAALTGATAAQVEASIVNNGPIIVAWRAALANQNPTPVDGEDAAAQALILQGWKQK